MMLMKHMATLLAITAAVATEQTGHTFRIETNAEDGVRDHEQEFQVYFYGNQTAGASSPTSQILLQTSPDNTIWYDVVQSTELTATGEKAETRDVAGAPLLKFVRAKTALGGGTAPSHTCEVRLVSNGSFRCKTVS